MMNIKFKQTLLLLIVFGIFCFVGYIIFNNNISMLVDNQNNFETKTASSSLNPPSGMLILSMSTATQTEFITSYMANPQVGSESIELLSDGTPMVSTKGVQSDLSGDSLFVSGVVGKDNHETGVYYFDSKTRQANFIGEFGFKARMLSYNSSTYELLVNAQQEDISEYSEMIKVDNWSVYTVDISNPQNPVDKRLLFEGGLNPVWVDEEHFVYIGGSGLRLRNIRNNTDYAILSFNGGLPNSEVSFTLSSDKNKLAIVFPSSNKVQIFDATKILLGSVEFVSEYINPDYKFYQPKFSPDGEHLALLALYRKAGEVSDSRVQIYDVDPFSLNTSFQLNDYNHERMFLDDWVTNESD